MCPIENLLRSLPSPHLRDEFLQDKLLGLLDDGLPLPQLLLQLVVLWSRGHSLLFGFLAEGSVSVLVFPVRVLPELTDEGFALLLVAAGFPVGDDFRLENLFTDFLAQSRLGPLTKLPQKNNIRELLLEVEGLLKDVKNSLEVSLAQKGLARAESAGFNLGVEGLEESAVAVGRLVEGLMPVEEQVVAAIHGRDILDIVVDLCDVKHGFKLERHSNCGNSRRKLFLLLWLLLARRWAHGLTRCLSLLCVFLGCCAL